MTLRRIMSSMRRAQAAAAQHAPPREAPSWECYWQLLEDLQRRADRARAPKSALRPASGQKPTGRKCGPALRALRGIGWE